MFINRYIERYKLLIIAIIFLLAGVLIETNVFERRFNLEHANHFQEVIRQKDKQAEVFAQKVSDVICENNSFVSKYTFFKSYETFLTQRGISFLIYENDSLTFWSNNSFYGQRRYSDYFFNKRVVFIDHSWFLLNQKKTDNFSIIVLTLIKNEYLYENNLLVNGFQSDFGMISSIDVSISKVSGYYKITDQNEQYLCSLSNNPTRKSNIIQRNVSVVLYFMGFIMFLVFMHHTLHRIKYKLLADAGYLILLLYFIFFRWWMHDAMFPYIFYTTKLFDPQYYAFSDFMPSLGDLFINAILCWFFLHHIARRLKQGVIYLLPRSFHIIAIGIVLLIIALYFVLVSVIIKSLIIDSNIEIDTNKILNLNFLSVISYVVIALLLHSLLLLLYSFWNSFSRRYNPGLGVLVVCVQVFAVAIAFFWFNDDYVLCLMLAMFPLQLLHFFVHYYKKHHFSYYQKVLFVLFLAVYTEYSIDYFEIEKQNNIKKLYALNLANEQDPIAEVLLNEVCKRIKHDSTLTALMNTPWGKEDIINQYLQKKYFGGFLNRYNLESTVCGQNSQFEPANQLNNCENYFNQIIIKNGIKLQYSNVYFLSNQNGTISYFCSFPYKQSLQLEHKLYIELHAKLIAEELGYPELLLNKKMQANSLFNEFAYAKYKNGKLVMQKGDVLYGLDDRFLQNLPNKEFVIFKNGGYDHFLYRINEEATIIISTEQHTVFTHIVSFSYVFLFFFLLLSVTELLAVARNGWASVQFNFKTKIQIAMMSVLIVSLVTIAIAMIILNVKQYRASQYDLVNEKVQSVLMELQTQLGDISKLSYKNSEQLNSLLVELSTVFFTDINLYDLEGNLIASSRNEIFDRGLTGSYMNINAFYSLSELRQLRLTQEETIGELRFLSSYTIFRNQHNQPLAYLNLPYFTKQKVFTEHISSLVVTIVNIYVLLITLATIVAMIISSRVTQPLFILKEKMRHIRIGGKNEQISWKSRDEIGSLIDDYNRMVQELAQSVRRLAENERETAWREMAKQIAHEIKNPLTPMKLNLQLLNRSWNSNDPEFGNRLKKISDSIIEQIDSLADTATEFSNFAKINQMHFEQLNIIALLNNVTTLFDDCLEAEIEKLYDLDTEIYINGDKEKLLRLFNNLIKNALQAIPENKDGLIKVDIVAGESWVVISIIDNGCGISPDVQSHLFEPNFTTKSSGSGLGLAITKAIVENHNGRIWFETEQDKGTSFYVELPLDIPISLNQL